MPSVAVLVPSRGVLAPGLIPAAIAALRDANVSRYDFFFSHEHPIPDCFNYLVGRALESFHPSHLWIIEEDIVPPVTSLRRMLSLNLGICAIDYTLKINKGVSYYRRDDLIEWVATGCVLINAEVFDRVPRPWFRSNQSVEWVYEGSSSQWYTRLGQRDPQDYGGHDIIFGYLARQQGFSLGIVPDLKCEHLNL